ncbi:MAG: phage tail sheath subtilisin-like domain-containing protein [Alphaproteobacteria bacterium]|nr:phage tail sheath subtilisin-like domain-containing protein [Alphaproteobacteria bacterium]
MNFETIPLSLRLPGAYVEISTQRAVRGLPGFPHKIVIFTQKLATGTLAAGVATRVTRPQDGDALCGRGSMGAAMIKAALKANGWTECWVIALEDKADGTAATGTLTVTGAPTSSGVYPLYIAGVKVGVGVAAGDSINATATKIAAAINANADMPVTAAAVNAVVTCTARHKGLCGNDIDMRAGFYPDETLPAGLAVTIVGMAAGAGNPDIADAIEAMGETWFTDIVNPWTDTTSLNALKLDLDARWTGTVMKDAKAYSFKRDTFGNLATFGNARNDGLATIMGSNDALTPTYVLAAIYCAVSTFQLGIDPARPLQNVAMPGALIGPKHFNQQERNLLLFDGIATCRLGDDGTVYIERAVTTYQKNAAGADDTALLDLETVATLALLRYTERTRILLRFPRMKLTDDGNEIAPGQAMVRPKDIRDELIALAMEWQRAGLVENIDDYVANLIVQRSADDPNRVNVLNPPDLVNQLRIYASKIEFRL